MLTSRHWIVLLTALFAVALTIATARAEDFSVKLQDLADIDAAQPIPQYKLDRVLKRTEVDRAADMPEKTFDVFMRFRDFGDVRLAEAGEAGPSTGKQWAKGQTFPSGLADFDGVKTGWLKDSPHQFIVAWLDEPDGRGNGHDFSHSYVILQLEDHRAQVLLRGSCAITGHLRNGVQEEVTDYAHFAYDAPHSVLTEKLSRSYETAGARAHDLAHLTKDEEGHDTFVAHIDETITLTYKIAAGKLVPGSCSLCYKTQGRDELSQIAHFYLGAMATNRVLLDANPALAAKHADATRGSVIYLDPGQDIIVPVPEKWLLDNFGHDLPAKQ